MERLKFSLIVKVTGYHYYKVNGDEEQDLPMSNTNIYYDRMRRKYIQDVTLIIETYFYTTDSRQIIQGKFNSLYTAMKTKPKGGLIGLVLEGIDRGILSLGELIDAFDIKCGVVTKKEKREFDPQTLIDNSGYKELYFENTTNVSSPNGWVSWR